MKEVEFPIFAIVSRRWRWRVVACYEVPSHLNPEIVAFWSRDRAERVRDHLRLAYAMGVRMPGKEG